MRAPIAAVTGGFGLVGSKIVEELIAAGWIVKILSRCKRDNLISDIQIIQSDINNPQGLKDLMEGVDAIFHCAGEIIDEKKMFSTNVQGTENLLNIVKQSNATFFCLLSSAGVIAKTNDNPITENTRCNPQNLYEKTKYEAELLVQNANLNMSVCILRPTNVVSSFKPGIILLPILDGWKEKLKVLIKGKENAHIVHVKDVARSAIFFLEKKIAGINIFFISIDADKKNNIQYIYNEYLMLTSKKHTINSIIPLIVPYILRKFFRNGGLHGKILFSNSKVINLGFVFQYDVDRIIREVHNNRSQRQ
jgi:nucleoside-diphosphate-sugar epimerase